MLDKKQNKYFIGIKMLIIGKSKPNLSIMLENMFVSYALLY